jgi:hypothetical protein
MKVPPHILRKRKAVAVRTLPIDYTEWDARTVVADSPTGDADFFWANPQGVGLRASMHYDTAAYSLDNGDFVFTIDPRLPDPGEGLFNYRAEIARRATVLVPVGSREQVGCTYVVPALKPRDTGFNIGQWHTGTGTLPGPGGLNSPVISLDIANEGTPDKTGDLAEQDEIVVVNKVTGNAGGNSGRINTGIIFTGTIHLRQELISGLGAAGYYRLQVKEGSGAWQTVYEENESTIWTLDSDGGSKSMVHPYWKLGLYQYGLVTEAGVEATEALNSGEGSYDISLRIRGKIKTCVILADDPFYATSDAINSVDTSV